jgi:flavin-dependent dehydrogenase
MEVKHDFVVVGGGPAGSAISILLAMAGARVALV